MDKIIDGKALANQIQQSIYQEIKQNSLTPSLAVILIGDDAASKIYVDLKKKASRNVGIDFHEYLLAKDAPTTEVLKVIDFLNHDEQIDAILVQLPLPKHLNTGQVIQAIDPSKDVDGFHPINIQKLLSGQNDFVPGLPLGIIKLIESTGENITGQTAVIISRSDVFYKPLEKLLNDRKVHVKTIKPNQKNLKTEALSADILIVSCGQPFFVTADMVKPGAIVIDVGTNKIDNNYVVGDVDFSAVYDKVKFITPVPGGVGPMTVAMLLYNTVELHKTRK